MKNEKIESRVENLMPLFFDQLLIKTLDVKWAICECVIDGKISDEELLESIGVLINQYEVIYYFNAIEYLSENDPSLSESLYIAGEYGMPLSDLDSEVLATVHIKERMLQMSNDGCSKFCLTFNECL